MSMFLRHPDVTPYRSTHYRKLRSHRTIPPAVVWDRVDQGNVEPRYSDFFIVPERLYPSGDRASETAAILAAMTQEHLIDHVRSVMDHRRLPQKWSPPS